MKNRARTRFGELYGKTKSNEWWTDCQLMGQVRIPWFNRQTSNPIQENAVTYGEGHGVLGRTNNENKTEQTTIHINWQVVKQGPRKWMLTKLKVALPSLQLFSLSLFWKILPPFALLLPPGEKPQIFHFSFLCLCLPQQAILGSTAPLISKDGVSDHQHDLWHAHAADFPGVGKRGPPLIPGAARLL